MIDAIKTDGRGLYLIKDPRARLPVSVDWSDWLSLEGTTISSSVWESATGITVDGMAATTTITVCYVSDGVADSYYSLRNTITTANGLVDSRSLRIVCKDR